MSTEENPQAFNLDELRRTYYGPDNLEQAAALFGQVQEAAGDEVNVLTNFDMEEGLADGFGLMFQPLKEKGRGENNEIQAVVVSAVPDISALMNDDKGREFISESLQRAFASKIATAVRVDAGESVILPKSISDFTERKTRGDTTKAFTETAKEMVQVLRKKGLSTLTVPLLRQTLQNAAMAESIFPNTKQTVWEKVIEVMAKLAEKKGHNTEIFQQWAATRNEMALPNSDIDLEGVFDELIG